MIFQVITQKDFYAKEAIVHILKALHIGYVQTLSLTEELVKINGSDLITKALDAKVVMPKDLFVEEEVVGSSLASRSTASGTSDLSSKALERLKVNAKNDLVVTQALLRKEQLEKLYTELEKIQNLTTVPVQMLIRLPMIDIMLIISLKEKNITGFFLKLNI